MGLDVISTLQDLTKVSPFIIAAILFPLVSCLISGLFLSTVIFLRLRRERVAPKDIIYAIRALKAGGNTETLVRLCVRNDSPSPASSTALWNTPPSLGVKMWRRCKPSLELKWPDSSAASSTLKSLLGHPPSWASSEPYPD